MKISKTPNLIWEQSFPSGNDEYKIKATVLFMKNDSLLL